MKGHIPDLSFPSINFGLKEVPWTLTPLLYVGGAGTDKRCLHKTINLGLKNIRQERIPLVIDIHSHLNGEVSSGGSRYTASTKINAVRKFYSWIDEKGKIPTHETIVKLYFEWSEALLNNIRAKKDGATLEHARNLASLVSSTLEAALDLKSSPFSSSSLSKKSRRLKSKLGTQSQKSSIEKCFAFGHMLMDLMEATTIDAIFGKLPLIINYRSGQTTTEWVGTTTVETPSNNNDLSRNITSNYASKELSDKSIRPRQTLINLRISAEMLVFIAQTQMNLSQAHKIKVGKFSLTSHNNGYQARRIYKNRRHGEVEFEFFSEYRTIFEKYLRWRNKIFESSSDDRLFPLISNQGKSTDKPPLFYNIKTKCRQLGLQYIGPRDLRQFKVNWLARMTKNSHLAAEMAQHALETSLRSYQKPNHQIAVIEVSSFLSSYESSIQSPGPGCCSKQEPTPVAEIAAGASEPNCISPAGCLYCSQHRDIDSLDHVWSLASYRHLKSLELALFRRPPLKGTSNPLMNVIELLTGKLNMFKELGGARSKWVDEALNRVQEEDYHPKWSGFIRLIEISA